MTARMPGQFRDLAGQIFGRLTAINPTGADKHGRLRWRCRCSCGGERVVLGTHLLDGNTRSCGCLLREAAALRNGRHLHARHGQRTPEYRCWLGMRTRCLNPRDHNYHHYGGRGIRICERWESFENFLADMGSKPSGRHSIERVDNDRGYEPGNCRWALSDEQAANRRKRAPSMLERERARVREAIRQASTPGVPLRVLAERFGVSRQTVCDALGGRGRGCKRTLLSGGAVA